MFSKFRSRTKKQLATTDTTVPTEVDATIPTTAALQADGSRLRSPSSFRAMFYKVQDSFTGASSFNKRRVTSDFQSKMRGKIREAAEALAVAAEEGSWDEVLKQKLQLDTCFDTGEEIPGGSPRVPSARVLAPVKGMGVSVSSETSGDEAAEGSSLPPTPFSRVTGPPSSSHCRSSTRSSRLSAMRALKCSSQGSSSSFDQPPSPQRTSFHEVVPQSGNSKALVQPSPYQPSATLYDPDAPTAATAFLIDLDGTMYEPGRLLPGAAAFFAWLRTSQTPFVFLSNTGAKNSAAVAEKFATAPYVIGSDPVPLAHIHTAAEAQV